MATTKDNPKLKNVHNFNIPDAKEFDMIDWLYENPQLVDKMNMANKQVRIKLKNYALSTIHFKIGSQ